MFPTCVHFFPLKSRGSLLFELDQKRLALTCASTGCIPPQLGDLRALAFLYLSRNKLDGEPWIKRLACFRVVKDTMQESCP